uniref:Peroxisomal multifunctional enzyme type 2 n=1 Tax=Lygus hesperus TaxID=30085 RepID=A0A146L102_LYGHE
MLAEVSLRFDGRVAVVTGAGAGLGRAYALLFGSRGASVVVNDLGGSRTGDGASSNVADQVVQEIRATGGKAVADYNSVTDGEKIIKTALDNFGRVDIVVNNAGILRDKSFARISDSDWNLVHDVHLRGAFKVTQAAWPHLRKQKYGRVIFTSSNSGLYGNFGQANYSAAKMGLVGLCNTLAIEGRSANINCNVIVPTAASRLTEDILPPDLFKELKPELIAPVVVWLCHEQCQENGAVIESAAGWASKYAIIRGQGSVFRKSISESATPENVRDAWGKISDTQSKFERISSIEEATGSLFGAIESLKSGDSTSAGLTYEDSFEFTNKDCILYALGIGITVQNPTNLRYLYENHTDFSMFPTQAIIPGQMAAMSSPLITSAIPGKTFDLSQVLHGEQYLEVYEPLPTSGTLRNVCKIIDILDKGRNAVVVTGMETYSDDGKKLCYGEMSAFIVNGGGFGGKRSSSKIIEPLDPPKRNADVIAETKTSQDQAALYRLSGDSNPLHIDPDFAAIGGFNRPILHGLCSLGISVRCLLQRYANNKAELFKSVKARFAKPVYPGETLRVAMWREGTRIHFETTSVESNQKVISGAYVDLHKVEVGSSHGLSVVATSAPKLKSDEVFNTMIERLKAKPELVKKINGVFLYKITSGGQEVARWTADLRKGKIYRGDPESGTKVDTTLNMAEDDLIEMATGKLSPQAAFMKGKLKIQGNIMLSQRLKDLITAESKL